MPLSPTDQILVSRGGVNYRAPVSQLDTRYQVKNENISALSVNGGSLAGFRNRIINGNFIVDQKNIGLLYSIPPSPGARYTADHWRVQSSGSAGTAQVLTNTYPSFTRQNMLRMTGGAGNTELFLYQRIESYHIANLAGSTVTVSFSTANSLRTTLNWSLTYPVSNDDYSSGWTTFASGTRTISSTMTRYSITAALPSQCTRGVQLMLSIPNQTSGLWDVCNIQLEPGPLATPFEIRPMQIETLLCQRYFQYLPLSLAGVATGPNQIIETPIQYPVPMRILPTVGSLEVDSRPGTTPQTLQSSAQGVFRRTIDFAAPYIQSSAAGQFYVVGYRFPLDAEY